jgi:F0F1-type ATP synthase assembly protein I
MAYPQEPSRDPKKPNPFDNYLKYSGLAIQLFVTIGVCGWLGYELDKYLQLEFPAFMIAFGMIGFGGFMYQLYRSLKN